MDIKFILLVIGVFIFTLGYVNQNKYSCSKKENIKNVNVMNSGLYSIFNSNLNSDGEKPKYNPIGTSTIMKIDQIGKKVNIAESNGIIKYI